MKPADITSYVGWLLILAALGFYGYGIYSAIDYSLSGTPTRYHAVLSTTIGSLQALLLTNLGMLLGISVANPNSETAKALKLTKGPAPAFIPEAAPAPLDVKLQVQLFALIVFVLSLIACFVTWAICGFQTETTEIVAAIPEAGKVFIGVVLAYVTAVLR